MIRFACVSRVGGMELFFVELPAAPRNNDVIWDETTGKSFIVSHVIWRVRGNGEHIIAGHVAASGYDGVQKAVAPKEGQP